MVRGLSVARGDDGSERPPRALPRGPQRPERDEAARLPVLPSLPLLEGAERASVDAQTLAARFLLGFSPNTARAYAGQLRIYFADCARRGVDPLEAGEDFVTAYAAGLADDAGDELAASTASMRMAAVRGFYRYAAEERVLSASPAQVTARRAASTSLAPLTVDGQAVEAHRAAAAFLVGYRGNTRKTYETNLRNFFTWCFRVRVNPLEVARPHVEAWRLHLEEGEGKSPATSNQHLSAVRSFFRYCVEEEILDRSPADLVRNRKTAGSGGRGGEAGVPRTSGLDRHEVIAFLEAARAYSPLYHAVLALLTLNGLRASEAGSANLDTMTTVRGHRVIYVSRKGYADQWPVPLAPYTVGAIDAYLEVRAAFVPRGREEEWAAAGPLFVSERGLRPSRGVVYDWVKRTSLRALPGRRMPVHPHELRHTFITLALDAGVPLRDVQDAAGHADPATTRRYDRGRHSLDRHATYALASYLASGATRAAAPYAETRPEGAETPPRPPDRTDDSSDVGRTAEPPPGSHT